MSNLPTKAPDMSAVESALVRNDISKLTTAERISYMNALCESVGLNPLTKPFALLNLQGREVVYATKDCTEQLRKIHGVSTQIISHGVVGDFYEVHIKAQDRTGRTDEDISVIPMVKGANDFANMKMKAVTKAKRRVTLSICGLGILDESELDTLKEVVRGADNPHLKPVYNEKNVSPVTPEIAASAKDAPLGEFVITFGKHKNKKLDEMDIFELNNYVSWILNKAKEENKEIQGQVKDFIEHAEAYLCSKEVPSTEENEEIPL